MVKRKKIKKLLKIHCYRWCCILLAPNSTGLDPYANASFKHWLTHRINIREKTAVRLLITGRVTRVGFRAYLRRKAKANGLRYWARNLKEKRVEVVLIGKPKSIESVIHLAWRGPKKAHVTKVEEYWFNKPIQSNGSKGDGSEPLSWSKGTAERIKETVEYLQSLSSILEEPSQYNGESDFSNAREVERSLEERNIFFTRFLRSSFTSSPCKKLGLQSTQSTNVSSIIDKIANHKHLTKVCLMAYGLPVPHGEIFTDLGMAREYVSSTSHPLAVKPVDGRVGKGITIDVRTEEDLKYAWREARKYHREVILEELVEGVDVRVLIVGGHAYGAYMRIPANVIGDGEKTIQELIDGKNEQRKKNPKLAKKNIIPNTYSIQLLRRQGYSMESTPEEGEMIFLHLKANLDTGGDSIAITQYISPDLMELAEEAARALSLESYCGVDLMVESIHLPREEQKCTVLEINSRAMFGGVQFPLFGEPANPARALVDHLFPEDTDDLSYPVESKRVELTGIFKESMLERLISLGDTYKMRGYLQKKGSCVEAILSGYRHHLLSYLSTLLDGKEYREGMVDGIVVSSYDGEIEDSFTIKEMVEEEKKDIQLISSFHTGDCNINDYSKETLYQGKEFFYYGKTYDLNLQLFLEEFERCGYEVEPLYEDLVKITKDQVCGITGMFHSSLFCDRVWEKYTPAKKILSLQGVPVRRGVRFKYTKLKKALYYFKYISKPCLVTIMHPKKYKSYKVTSKKRLKKVWRKAEKKGTKYILIEEYIKGYHVLVPVVRREAIGALMLESLYLLGDGVSCIRDLIEEKNRLRNNNPYYSQYPIKRDKHLKKELSAQGYQLKDILAKGVKVYLESDLEYRWGGETVSISHLLHKDFYKKAVEAVSCFPNLFFGVVHMMIPCPDLQASKQPWVVRAIDTKPEASIFHFPWRGDPILLLERVVHDLCLAHGTHWITDHSKREVHL